MSKIKAIFATGSRGEFGRAGKLPWDKLTGDLPRFLAYTKGAVVVMGRSTWDSLPKKLQGRINVVMSSNKQVTWKEDGDYIEFPDVVMNGSLYQSLMELKAYHPDRDIVVIGGKSVIEGCIPYCDEVSWTESWEVYHMCDVFLGTTDIRIAMHQARLHLREELLVLNKRFGDGANYTVKTFRK